MIRPAVALIPTNSNPLSSVVEAASLPVCLYSVLPNTAYSMPVEMVAKLAADVAGIKDSSGKVVRLQAIVDSTPDRTSRLPLEGVPPTWPRS